jgi:hypothetical protein
MGRLAKRAKRAARVLGALALASGLAWPSWALSINDDPNDPLASREERIQRQERLIRNGMSQVGQAQAQASTPAGAAEPSSPNAQAPGPDVNAVAPPPIQVAPMINPAGGLKSSQPRGAKKPKEPSARSVMLPYATFFLNPSVVVANVGERFVTRAGVLNAACLEMDEVQVVLAYDPDVLAPTAIYQDRLLPLLAGQPTVALDKRAGTLIYRARLATPNSGADLATIAVQWETLRPALATIIRTGTGDLHSGPFFNGKFLATNSLGTDTAQLGAVARVDARRKGPSEAWAYDDSATTMALQAVAPASLRDPSRPPRLWIDQPASGDLQPGQWLVIDIGVDNPGLQPIDEARLACAYDPDAVELIDADRHRQLVSTGSNALDGPFRALWPWNALYMDKIDQEHGTFYYRMTSQQPVARRAAPLARLLARVKTPTQAPVLQWIWNGDADATVPQTGLFVLGRNIYDGLAGLDKPTQAETVQAIEAHDQPDREKADPKSYRF